MIILDENEEAVYLHDIKAPVVVDYFWTLNLSMMDFTLSSLDVLIETTGPALKLRANNFNFWVPASWYILIYDLDNSILDICTINELSWKSFSAVTYGNNQLMISATNLSVTDYNPDKVIVSPALNNDQMLCHPITPTKWISVTPNNVYNKFLKNKTIGDLF